MRDDPQHPETPHQQAKAVLGKLWDEGIASGPATDGEEAFARLKHKLDAELARRQQATKPPSPQGSSSTSQ